jgi:hypothetical protein
MRFAQPRALGLKVSDEFTVPLCRGHHRQLHQAGDEVAWWGKSQINALEMAQHLWEQSHAKAGAGAGSESEIIKQREGRPPAQFAGVATDPQCLSRNAPAS